MHSLLSTRCSTEMLSLGDISFWSVLVTDGRAGVDQCRWGHPWPSAGKQEAERPRPRQGKPPKGMTLVWTQVLLHSCLRPLLEAVNLPQGASPPIAFMRLAGPGSRLRW